MEPKSAKNKNGLPNRASIRSRAEKKRESVRKQLDESRMVKWLILMVLTVLFCILTQPDFFAKNEKVYGLGDVAEKNIKARQDFFIEDEAATKRNSQLAAEKIRTVYDHDTLLVETLRRRVDNSFRKMRSLFALTENTKRLEASGEKNEAERSSLSQPLPPEKRAWEMKPTFEEELGISVSKGAFQVLVSVQFSPETADLINEIITRILDNGVVANKEILLKEEDRGIRLRDIQTQQEILTGNLKRYYSLDQAKTMVRVVGQPILKNVNYAVLNLVVDFSQRLIQPNITINRSETAARIETATTEIKPVMYRIKAGEMILREGERVTEIQLQKLKAAGRREPETRPWTARLGTAVVIVCILVTIYVLFFPHAIRTRSGHNKNLLFMSCVLAAFFLLSVVSWYLSDTLPRNESLRIPSQALLFGTPIASGAMTVCVFLGLELAIPFALLSGMVTGILFNANLEMAIYFLVGGLMGGYWIRECKERQVFIKAGLKLGILNSLLVTGITTIGGDVSGIHLLWNWFFGAMGGIGAGVIAAGMVPLLELAFGFSSDIKLLEQANLDQPILKRLMLEAPGSYHHSVIVGSMVEAAASEIGANPLLAKVCGYYHDIGKIKQPAYFIENQINGKNRHDKLAPSMSALILIAHLKHGVEIAKTHKLGRPVIDTIRQHHGTSLIRYFYDKAKQLKGSDSINIDDFRYPGPKPQSKEAALVMLADVVEAASRTLDNPTPARIQGMVQNLFNKVFADGQLDDCELTLKDLHSIAKSYYKILNGIHHHRIEYPEKLVPTNGRTKNGNTNRQPTANSLPESPDTETESENRLKRLGLS